MKNKWLTRKNFIRIFFGILLIVTVHLVSSVLSIKSKHGVDQKDGMYWQPEDTIDVAMMGTSHVHCGVNTALLWENYGIAAYDYSGAEQPLWMTYYYLVELYKYQNPKVIILDLYGPAHFKEDYQYAWIAENIHGMRFSFTKLQMLTASVEPNRFFDYFPSFAVYHSRYDDIDREDFGDFVWNSQEKEAFKGYTPYWLIEPQIKPDFVEEGSAGLTEKSEKYLRKIISYVKKKNSKLILVNIPYIVTPGDQQTYNQIRDIANQEDILFIDFNEHTEEIGLNYEKDFNDESHLNYWGSSKFSDYLGTYLSSEEEIPNHKEESGYESWDKHVLYIRKELEIHGNTYSDIRN